MKTQKKAIRAIISGGGTGGHIFPALSIADKLKEANPDTEILFVGAKGRMEMEKVPAAGYRIEGLDVAGLKRSLSLSNMALPLKYLKSIRKAGRIIQNFKPDIVIGVGGYCSAPVLWAAQRKGVPTLIQEQNGYAGLTNKILGKKAKRICVAYEGMERFFPEERIVMTGNPIRKDIVPATEQMKKEGLEYYGLSPDKKHLLVVGGSLGCKTLNEAMKMWILDGCPGGGDIEVIWQCGKYYKQSTDEFMSHYDDVSNIKYTDFIKRMDLAYAVADLVISRSGASSVSEICAAHKASILVPSPNVTEDHQTHNAMALVNRKAGVLVTDAEAPSKLMIMACVLLDDKKRLAEMESNVAELAITSAADLIVEEIYRILQ